MSQPHVTTHVTLPESGSRFPTKRDYISSEHTHFHAGYNANDNLKQAQSFSFILKRAGAWQLASDIASLFLAFICGGVLASVTDMYFKGGFQQLVSFNALMQFIIFTGLGALALVWLDTRGHYRQRLPYWEIVGNILTIACAGFLVCGFVQFVQQASFSRLWLGLSWLFFAVFLFSGRSFARRVLENRGQWQIPAILVGEGRAATAAMQALAREPAMGFTLVEQILPKTLSKLAKPYAWKELLMECSACHVFLALEGREFEDQQAALKYLVRERLPFSIIPSWPHMPVGTLSAHHFPMNDVLLFHDTNRLLLPLSCMIKRSFDLVVSGIALLLCSPVFLLVALLVRSDGGPAFFRQDRVGRNGRIFQCYKFRSMRVDAERLLDAYLASNPDADAEWKKFQKLKHDVRITKLGRFIRNTSIDELPQLLNVLKGDMSLVGPRPIMPEQKEFYGDDFIFYESVRPGITGPWQVSGRNRLTFSERVTLECSYARNWTLWMDIVILLKTVPVILKRDQAF